MQQKQNEEQYYGFAKAFFHFVFWLLVIHFVFDIIGLYHSFQHLFDPNEKQSFDEAFILLPVTVGLFYWNLLYLIPKFLNKDGWIRYCLALLFSYLLLFFFSACLYDLLYNSDYELHTSRQHFLDDIILFNLLSAIASTALGIAKISVNNLQQKRAAEKKQKEAEFKYLANQFNPHFLYNTLNGIYSKAIEENATETTEAILRLSEIMRYPIKQGLKREVPLQEEVAFIEDYIELQKLRLGYDYPIQFKKETALEGVKILPLSLIVLVENAFKYGVSQKDETPISFELKSTENQLFFITKNQVKDDETESSHKIGLQNLKYRLQLIYGNEYSLKALKREGEYVVNLSIINNGLF